MNKYFIFCLFILAISSTDTLGGQDFHKNLIENGDFIKNSCPYQYCLYGNIYSNDVDSWYPDVEL